MKFGQIHKNQSKTLIDSMSSYNDTLLCSTDMIILKLGFYLASKFAITIAFTIIYVYTAEMFPTEVRQTLSASASTIGRTGSMIAPHTILLVRKLLTSSTK